MFKNRKLIIATKHNKESVIAPILEKELGVNTFVDATFDTDMLGTFSGEVEREEDAFSTAREKCLLAMRKNNCDLGIASEGSFGPHPSMFFVHADDEILIFIDKINDLEIIVRILSTETNFNASEIYSKEELKTFAYKAKFPSHALIIKKSKNDFDDMLKGIANWDVLSKKCEELIKKFGCAYVETDMRAMYNPTRMSVIETLTQKLAAKIKSSCPNCERPGLGITSIKEGLPCSLCGKPTRSIKSHLYECEKCDYVNEVLFPNQKETEDPMYCDYCNP